MAGTAPPGPLQRLVIPRPGLQWMIAAFTTEALDDRLISSAVTQCCGLGNSDRLDGVLDFFGRLWLPTKIALPKLLCRVVHKLRRFSVH
jgi:hypothetical protein